MKKLGIAIIGTGDISYNHLEGYLAESDRCNIVAFCNLHTEKCKKLAKAYDLDVKDLIITDDYRTLLDRDDIDVVSICLPPSAHCKIACDQRTKTLFKCTSLRAKQPCLGPQLRAGMN